MQQLNNAAFPEHLEEEENLSNRNNKITSKLVNHSKISKNQIKSNDFTGL